MSATKCFQCGLEGQDGRSCKDCGQPLDLSLYIESKVSTALAERTTKLDWVEKQSAVRIAEEARGYVSRTLWGGLVATVLSFIGLAVLLNTVKSNVEEQGKAAIDRVNKQADGVEKSIDAKVEQFVQKQFEQERIQTTIERVASERADTIFLDQIKPAVERIQGALPRYLPHDSFDELRERFQKICEDFGTTGGQLRVIVHPEAFMNSTESQFFNALYEGRSESCLPVKSSYTPRSQDSDFGASLERALRTPVGATRVYSTPEHRGQRAARELLDFIERELGWRVLPEIGRIDLRPKAKIAAAVLIVFPN